MYDTSISFMRSLCAGEIEEAVLFPFPTLSDDEREILGPVVESVDDLLGGRDEEFRAWDVAGEMAPEFLQELREFGLFGLVIPEADGGLGFGNMAYSRTVQQVARHDASVAVTIGAHSSIGMRGLKLYGTDDQKKKYYEALANGTMIAAFCLTEPEAGSDAASIKTQAVEKEDHFLLNGAKLWVTNGGIASFFTVFAKTGEKDERSRLSAFIVTRDMEGVSVGVHEDKMGIRREFDLYGLPRGRQGPEGKPPRPIEQRLQSGHEHPQQRPFRPCRRLCRRDEDADLDGVEPRHGTPSVRPTDRLFWSDQAEDRPHGCRLLCHRERGAGRGRPR